MHTAIFSEVYFEFFAKKKKEKLSYDGIWKVGL